MVMEEVDFQLIHNDGFTEVMLKQGDLIGCMIADAEVPDFSVGVELIEGSRKLIIFYEGVGAMKRQKIKVTGPEAGERRLDGFDDVVTAEIIPLGWAIVGVGSRHNPTLPLEDEPVSQGGILLQGIADDLLRFPHGIDVSQVDMIDAAIDRGGDQSNSLLFGVIGGRMLVPFVSYVPCAVGQA